MIRPSRVRLIVSDIDGTLVDREKRVPRYTRKELRRIRRQYGVNLVLASARMPSSIHRLQDVLGGRAPLIAFNGALTLDADPGETGDARVLVSEVIPVVVVRELLDSIRGVDAHLGLYTANQWVVEDIDYWALREVRGTGVWPTVGPFEEAIERWSSNDEGIYKILIRGESGCIADLRSSFGAELQGALEFSHGSTTLIDVVSRAAGKARALETLLDTLGVEPSEVMAFGDNANDAEMLAMVGHGVAMANAGEAVKATADEVTLTNDEDGVGFLLGKYFP